MGRSAHGEEGAEAAQPLPTGGARRGSQHKICGESTRDLVDAILQMRVDPGQQLVAGQPAGASTGAPATAATAAETHPKRGPAGESTGPAAFLPPLADTQQGDPTEQLWRPAVAAAMAAAMAVHNKELPRSHPHLRPARPRQGAG